LDAGEASNRRFGGLGRAADDRADRGMIHEIILAMR